MAKRRVLGSLRWARAIVLGASVTLMGATVAHDAPAADPVNAARDIQTSDDFRVRVSAALTLGRTNTPGSRVLLEQALSDTHPAVRIAAAAGLAALGDAAALPALRAHLASEHAPGVKAQIAQTITSLSGSAPAPAARPGDDRETRWQSTRYVVALGNMHNRSQVPGSHASDVLRAATETHAKTIPGALVSDSSDTALFEQAAARHVPVFMLDGSLQRLSRGRKDSELSYNAQVDYSMRRVPQQQLRGMLSGSATSFGSVNALHDPSTVTALEDQAIDGAVESALRGAARGFGDASR